MGWVVGLVFCFSSLSPEIAALDLIIKSGSVLYQAAQRFLANHISDNSGVCTRMQFVIKSEILDGRLPCKWERKKKDASLIAGCPWAGASVGLSAAGLV